MTDVALQTWADLNQRYLGAALAALRRRLGGETDAPGAEDDLRLLAGEMPAHPAIEMLRQAFGLSSFERDLLLLCAGVELDPALAAAVAGAAGSSRSLPTFGLALAVLDEPHWSALSPAGPLRRWRLIEPLDGPSLTASPLRVAERVLHAIAGLDYLDEQLAGVIELDDAPPHLAPSHERLAAAIVDAWTTGEDVPALVQLVGAGAGSAQAVAAGAAGRLGMRLAILHAADVPLAAREREELMRLWEREAALGSSVLLVDCQELDGTPAEERALSALLGRLVSPVIAHVRRRLPVGGRRSLQLAVAPPDARERLALLEGALGSRAVSVNGRLPAIAQQFALDAAGIRSVAGELALRSPAVAPDDAAAALWDLCRDRTRPRLDGLAQRIEPAAGWDDLVLPATQKQVLRDVAVHVRQRARVYGDWGFGGPGRRGLGISALFTGASGTGKTMAAEVLASELGLDLYRIDLSQVVSKYIGETEKNLARLFDAAEGGGVVLLFDEADALFGKRSEVRDSHDRYANIEVSYLLQRMEAYEGLAILTTNLKGALDPAFMRRVRFVVPFPFPVAEARAAIWRRIFPAGTPVDGLDHERLARLSITGGSIRNIALNAAFFAAEEGAPVGMSHLLRAARSEAAKLERPLSEAEIRGWAERGDDVRGVTA